MWLTQNVSFCKLTTFELVNIPPLNVSTELHCPIQGESGEGMAGRQAGGGGHLPAQTEFEWDTPDPIPAFVPVTGQIPGPPD